MNNKPARILIFVGALAIALIFLSGQVLIEQDTTQLADAIVVIGGDHKPERMQRAVELFRQGFAPIVVISAGTRVLEGEEKIPEAEVMRRQAINLGLPTNVILVEDNSQSTYENAKFTKPILEQLAAQKVLLVTSAFHSRRAKRIFQDVLEPCISVTVQPAQADAWFALWIFRPNDLYVLLYEYQNWVRYWLGQNSAN
jgi:uncharacterized SAM-binding protein YcdF (DUF218 family)